MGQKRRLSRLVSQPLADLYPRLRPATSCRHIALGKHTRTGRQAQRRRQTERLAHRECGRLVAREREREREGETRETETLRERERQKVAGDAPRCRRCAARRIVAAPTTGSKVWPRCGLTLPPQLRRLPRSTTVAGHRGKQASHEGCLDGTQEKAVQVGIAASC